MDIYVQLLNTDIRCVLEYMCEYYDFQVDNFFL